MWALNHSAWAGPCADSFDEVRLAASVLRAEDALRNLDDAGFLDQLNALAGFGVPCLGVVPDPQTVSRYHRLMALHLYSLGDDEGARAAAAASWRLDPSPPPTDLVSADHSLRPAWNAGTEVRDHKVPQPRDGLIAFDGAVTRLRPAGVPAVFQELDASGLVRSTRYLGAREPMPEYVAVPRRRTTLLVATGLAAVGAATSFGVAATARAELYRGAADLRTPGETLDGHRQTANLWTLVGAVGVAAAGGLGTGAALVGPR